MSTCVHIVKLDTVCDYEINIKIKVYRCMSPSVHIAGVFFRERGKRVRKRHIRGKNKNCSFQCL
jgi:hypothetical protein